MAATPSLLYLSRADIESLSFSPRDVFTVVHDAYLMKGEGGVESPPKRGIVPAEGATIRAMKAYLPGIPACGVKWISAYPYKVDAKVPTITGILVLNAPDTGLPIAVMDCAWITAMRTAASTAVSARYLAKQESASVGIVASGLQGRTNLEALCEHFPIQNVFAYDHKEANAKRYAKDIKAKHGVDVHVVKSAEAAVKEADIVVTSLPVTKEPKPFLELRHFKEGALVCLLDFDASLVGSGYSEADLFVCDDVEQLSFFKSIGYCQGVSHPDADLGKVVARRVSGRRTKDQRIVAMNLGIGLLDIALGHALYCRAVDRGVGVSLPL